MKRKTLMLVSLAMLSAMAIAMSFTTSAFAGTQAVPACENSNGQAAEKNKHCVAGPPTDPCYVAASTTISVLCVKATSCRVEITGTGLHQLTSLVRTVGGETATYHFDELMAGMNPPGSGTSVVGDGSSVAITDPALCGATVDQLEGFVGLDSVFVIVGPIAVPA